MNNTVVDDEWYSVESGTMLKKILLKLDEINQSVTNVAQRISQLEQKMEKLELNNNEKVKDLKQISSYLQELHIIKEREINALLREHIPFPFVLKKEIVHSPQSYSRFIKK
jgi:hypothetical protein